jgi:hypothetical protein
LDLLTGQLHNSLINIAVLYQPQKKIFPLGSVQVGSSFKELMTPVVYEEAKEMAALEKAGQMQRHYSPGHGMGLVGNDNTPTLVSHLPILTNCLRDLMKSNFKGGGKQRKQVNMG